ncbi:hypothetical protein TcasGA2_TC014671 [Tribolium castaneum]|uniref:Uncharacterized protein n=1 Tax=Tribolium castaneum TaxID=7070 RepID=D6WNI3_TRICA|nr:hypothetical protein TcasGA2_TC014671 [Tribolium castaneum]
MSSDWFLWVFGDLSPGRVVAPLAHFAGILRERLPQRCNLAEKSNRSIKLLIRLCHLLARSYRRFEEAQCDMPIEIYDYGSEEHKTIVVGTDSIVTGGGSLKSCHAVGHGSLLQRGSNRDSSQRKQREIYRGTTNKDASLKFRSFVRPTDLSATQRGARNLNKCYLI